MFTLIHLLARELEGEVAAAKLVRAEIQLELAKTPDLGRRRRHGRYL
jgi:hypothetical protein